MHPPRLFLLVVIIRADGGTEVALEDAGLEVNRTPPSTMGILPLKIGALGELPCFDTKEEEEGGNEDDTPFPADTSVPEHNGVDDWNVEDREDGDKTAHDGEEQELVAPHIVEPLSEVLLRARLHHEEGAAHINHLPRKKQREPGQAGESGSTSAEDSCTRVIETLVAAGTKVAITETEHNDREGGETKGCDPETVE